VAVRYLSFVMVPSCVRTALCLLDDERCLFKAVSARDAHDDWFNELATKGQPQSIKSETTKQVTESKASERSTASSHQGGDAQQGQNCVCWIVMSNAIVL
jgi:hypothetical protein